MGEVVDIHCHILPSVDDGSENLDMSMQMLRQAAAEGITRVVLTPHYKNHRHSVSGSKLDELFQRFQKVVSEENLPIKMYLGNEVFFFPEMDIALEKGKLHSMNASKYMLVEFHPTDSFQYIRNGLLEVMNLGLHPVLAHAERYLCLRSDADRIEELHDMGVKIQLNVDTIIGKGGIAGWKNRFFAGKLLKKKLVDFVGTDAHDMKNRSPMMKKCSRLLYRRYEDRYVREILYRNAIRYFGL